MWYHGRLLFEKNPTTRHTVYKNWPSSVSKPNLLTSFPFFIVCWSNRKSPSTTPWDNAYFGLTRSSTPSQILNFGEHETRNEVKRRYASRGINTRYFQYSIVDTDVTANYTFCIPEHVYLLYRKEQSIISKARKANKHITSTTLHSPWHHLASTSLSFCYSSPALDLLWQQYQVSLYWRHHPIPPHRIIVFFTCTW